MAEMRAAGLPLEGLCHFLLVFLRDAVESLNALLSECDPDGR